MPAPPLIRSRGDRLDISGAQGTAVTRNGSRHDGAMADDAASIAEQRMETARRVQPILVREIAGIGIGEPFTKLQCAGRAQAFGRDDLHVVHEGGLRKQAREFRSMVSE